MLKSPYEISILLYINQSFHYLQNDDQMTSYHMAGADATVQ